jgi:TRAP-type C4-dicarboxylate transport system substrate-binding protein
VPNKIYEVQKYLTNWHYSYDALVVAVNKDVWNSLPADIQEQIEKAAKDAMAWEIELSRKSIDEGIQLLKDKGVEVTDLSPEELEPFREKTAPVYEKYASEKVGKEIVTAFEEAIAKSLK